MGRHCPARFCGIAPTALYAAPDMVINCSGGSEVRCVRVKWGKSICKMQRRTFMSQRLYDNGRFSPHEGKVWKASRNKSKLVRTQVETRTNLPDNIAATCFDLYVLVVSNRFRRKWICFSFSFKMKTKKKCSVIDFGPILCSPKVMRRGKSSKSQTGTEERAWTNTNDLPCLLCLISVQTNRFRSNANLERERACT